MPSSPAARPVFEIDEICVCFQKKTPYDAKVIGWKDIRGVRNYTIHYNGWAKRYDEMVSINSGRIIKGTLEEYQIANNLPVKPSSAHTGRARKSMKREVSAAESRPSSSMGGSDIQDSSADEEAGTSRKVARRVEPADVVVEKKLEIEFTEPLRQILVNDYGMMLTRRTKLVVPDDGSVDDIIENYVATMERKNGVQPTIRLIPDENEKENLHQIIGVYTARAIVDYFNILLGSHLLYPSERAAYEGRVKRMARAQGLRWEHPEDLAVIGFRASEHYGIVHLLRMLSRFNEYYGYSTKDAKLGKHVETGIASLMEYLTDNHESFYFGDDSYAHPPGVPSTSSGS